MRTSDYNNQQLSDLLQEELRRQLPLPLPGDVPKWEMNGEDFATAIRNVQLGFKSGHNIAFRVTRDNLTAIHTTSDDRFSASSTVAIKASNLLGEESACFSIAQDQAERAMLAFDRWGRTTFTYERSRNVTWVTDKHSVVPLITKSLSCIVSNQTTSNVCSIDATQLKSACATATVFHKRKVDRLSTKFNLTLDRGFAVHGYPHAAARFPMKLALPVTVPGAHVANFLQIASRARGTVRVMETIDQMMMRDTHGLCCSWPKGADLLPDMNHKFEAPDNARLELNTLHLQMAVTLLAAFTTDLSISTSRDERSAHIALTGNFKGYPVRSCVFFSADTAEHLDCVVKTEDLALACCALTGESLTIRATESGLIVQGVGHEGNKQFLLRRFDPQG